MIYSRDLFLCFLYTSEINRNKINVQFVISFLKILTNLLRI